MKLINLVRRKPGISREAFRTHWETEVASALTKSASHRSRCLGYVQNFTCNPNMRFSPTTHRFSEDWDAIDEYWYADAQQADADLAELSIDSQMSDLRGKVIDMTASLILRAEEVILTGKDFTGDTFAKVFIFIAPKPGITQQRFFQHWTEIHGPLWAGVRSGKGYQPTLRSVQNYLPEEMNPRLREFGYFGITEGWHESLASMGLPFRSVEHDEIIVPDANKFTDRARVCDTIVEERRVF
jgi:hypothetical protein